MTSAQTKQLLAVSRKALALLDPSWPIAHELKAILNQPVVTTAKKTGLLPCTICAQPVAKDDGQHWLNGKRKTPASVHNSCAAQYKAECHAIWDKWDAQIAARFEQSKFLSIKDLEYCACGHKGNDHTRDEMDNLLACDVYDDNDVLCDCDHFNYHIEEVSEELAA